MFVKGVFGVMGAVGLLAGSVSGVELRLKWEPGKRYIFSEEMSSAMTMQMGGAAMATKSEVTQETHYDVVAHEKGAEVRFAIDAMKMSVSMNGQEMMAFDSADENGGGGMGAMLKPLLNLKASVIYDKEGQVVDVKGLEGLQGMEQVGMGKEEIEQMVKQSSVLLPGKDVEPGATWDAEMEMPLGQLAKKPAVMSFKLKFEGMEKVEGRDLARISLSGSVRMDAGDGDAAAFVLESKKISGTMFFDVALGQPRETTMQMELEMGLPEGVPVAEGAPGKMPMSMVSTQKLKSVEEAK